MNKKIFKDKKGIFGLTAVQQFFVIILAIALLAYVIVIIMGSLSQATIVPASTGSKINDTIAVTTPTNYVALSANTNPNCQATLTSAQNGTFNIPVANFSVSGCTISPIAGAGVNINNTNINISYTFTYDGQYISNSKSIIGNTSGGVSGFFSSINPVYAILAVLVIILVLVVLVRVVSAPSGSAGRSPQL